jgi:hypothetical protein
MDRPMMHVGSPRECPCPKCDRPGRWLEAASESARVDYFHCDLCGHTWSVPKEECEPARDVTVRS